MLHTCISKGITYQIVKMRRMTMLLIYTVMLAAYVHANPHSRIENPHSDIYNQYSDKTLGINNAAASAAAAAASAAQSYSSVNSGSYNGYASAASSSVSYSANNVNLHPGYPKIDEVKAQFPNVNRPQSIQSTKSDRRSQDYWWMNANSPFESNVQLSSGCNSNQCSGGNGVGSVAPNENDKRGQSGQSDINVQGNPFFHSNVNIGLTQTKKQHDISKNPFFSGAGLSGASSSVSTSLNVNSAPNQFQQNYHTNFGEIGQKSEQTHNTGYYEQSVNQGNINRGELSVSCSGNGKICVAKHLCSNGYVSGSVQGLTQVKSDNQQCAVNSEVCCTLSNVALTPVADQATAGTYEIASHSINQVDRHDNGGVFQYHNNVNLDATNQRNGGIFGQFNRQQEIELNAGDQTRQNVDLDDNSKGYLPPIGSEPSSNIPAFSKPPQSDEPDRIPSPSAPAPTHVQIGCAAALMCVKEEYCAMDGMINPTPLTLSSEQLIRRVPLSDCKNPDNGIIGKCCRDPNYVDPWPTGNLPANYTGGFDEQGFPTFLNIQKTRPTKKPRGSPVKGGFSQAKNTPQFSVTPTPVQQLGFAPTNIPIQFTNIPNRAGPNFINVLGEESLRSSSTLAPSITYVKEISPATDISASTNKPFPNFPNFPNPFSKNKFDESSSNTNPIVIPPQVRGIQCGIKNSVQRQSGLNDVDVGFGEIPWEAMILSNREKKLLCSGAIIASNLVITAARCVNGFKADEISIKAGEWKLGYELKHEEPLPFEIVQVASIIIHPGYQLGYSSHDVAILMLDHSVTFDKHIGTICIGQPIQQSPALSERKCISTGWGKHVLQSHLSGAIMHSIDIDIVNRAECQQRILNAENQIELDDSLICTKAHKQNNNMCQVDLGGPLACDRGDGIYELIGVYNQDTGCLPTNQIATFALIDHSWIEYITANPRNFALELNAPVETLATRVPYVQSRKDEPCDCQKSVLPPEDNQYLPPV